MKQKLISIAGQFRFTAWLSFGFSALSVVLLLVGLKRILSLGSQPQVQQREIFTQIIIQVILIVILAILGTIIGFTMRARIRRSVKAVSLTLADCAAGNFTKRAQIYTKDEIADMSQAVNEAMVSLSSLVVNLRSGVDGLRNFAVLAGSQAEIVKTGNDRVLESSNRLSETGTELGQTAQTLTENGTAVAGDIANLSEIASSNEILRSEGITAARNLSNAVNELKTSVEYIMALMTDISVISEQTNMLALNATIEAARSAEAGRGFAVVANQAKDLASQTAQTTGEVISQVAQLQTQAIDGEQRIESLLSQLEALSASQQAVNQDVNRQETALSNANTGIDEVRSFSDELFTHSQSLASLSHSAHTESEQFQDHMSVVQDAVSTLDERMARFTV
ncbi:methyl-accepting chemotaxis protein [uncultured Mobiluncus sp.]|uniref:methyl-accepting chemotaxis protein n=1 Tax=uncultured Mobiluncus sp. TaxID=293425 RepID=UPI0026203992|nr:methyl-accepting chemotaxis protein [uncultured Mobiluncus sp.]